MKESREKKKKNVRNETSPTPAGLYYSDDVPPAAAGRPVDIRPVRACANAFCRRTKPESRRNNITTVNTTSVYGKRSCRTAAVVPQTFPEPTPSLPRHLARRNAAADDRSILARIHIIYFFFFVPRPTFFLSLAAKSARPLGFSIYIYIYILTVRTYEGRVSPHFLTGLPICAGPENTNQTHHKIVWDN